MTVPAVVPAAQPRGRICMDLHPGERLVLGDTGVEIEIVRKSGRAVRMHVLAPHAIRITRATDAQQSHNSIPSMAA